MNKLFDLDFFAAHNSAGVPEVIIKLFSLISLNNFFCPKPGFSSS